MSSTDWSVLQLELSGHCDFYIQEVLDRGRAFCKHTGCWTGPTAKVKRGCTCFRSASEALGRGAAFCEHTSRWMGLVAKVDGGLHAPISFGLLETIERSCSCCCGCACYLKGRACVGSADTQAGTLRLHVQQRGHECELMTSSLRYLHLTVRQEGAKRAWKTIPALSPLARPDVLASMDWGVSAQEKSEL